MKKAAILLVTFLCLAFPGYSESRDVTLQWDASIDAPVLQSYRVYYYTASQAPSSLNTADYALAYTLVGQSAIPIDPLTAPRPITIHKDNTQITLHFSDATKDYYFVVTAIDTRGLESVPTAEVSTVSVIPPPAIAVTINSGALVTNNPAVTLNISVPNTATYAQMQFSNDGFTWSAAEPFGAAKSWTLPSGDGPKTVYAKVKDSLGVWSAPCSAAITLDTTPPSLTIGNPSATVSGTGPVSYVVTYAGASAVTLSDTDVMLIRTGTANGTVTLSGTGTAARTVTIANITGNGALGIAIAAGTARDAAGNLAGASGSSVTFSVENQEPPIYLSSKITAGNIPGIYVVIVDSTGTAVATCNVAADGSWVSQLLPAGQYDWYLVYGSLISAKNATVFNTEQLKSISGTVTGLPSDGGALSVRSESGKLQKTITLTADGPYTVNHLVPAGDYIVAVVAKGVPVTYYQNKTNITEANSVNIQTANATKIDFAVTVPDSHITGKITDTAGSVGGLTVYGYEVNTSAMVFTTALADGSYNLLAAPGSYLVFLVKGNGKTFYFANENGAPTQNMYYAVTRTIAAPGQTVGNTNIDITEGDQILEGQIAYRTATGVPVVNALVMVSTDREQSLGMTDQNGHYQVSGLKKGTTYNVQMRLTTGNYPVQTTSIVAGTDRRKDFVAGAGPVLSGTISSKADPAKKVASAMLYLKDRTTGSLIGGRVYYSGSDGAYNIQDMPSGTCTLEVFHRDYRGYSADIVVGSDIIMGASNLIHDVAMEAGAFFKGAVKDSGGNPLAGAMVIASRAGATSIYGTANASGTYSIYGLDSTKNDYILTVHKRDYVSQTVAGKQPSAAGTSVDFTLVKPAATYQLSGGVKTSDNAAVRDATVLVSSKDMNFYASATTDASGAYAVNGLLHAGVYTISVVTNSSLPMQTGSVTVDNADVSMNFTIPLGKEIGGMVFGSPAFPSGKNIYVFLYKGDQYMGFTKATAGTFLFRGLAEGSDYKVLAVAEGYVSQWYNGKSDLATANTLTSGNTAVAITLNAAQ